MATRLLFEYQVMHAILNTLDAIVSRIEAGKEKHWWSIRQQTLWVSRRYEGAYRLIPCLVERSELKAFSIVIDRSERTLLSVDNMLHIEEDTDALDRQFSERKLRVVIFDRTVVSLAREEFSKLAKMVGATFEYKELFP